MIFLTCLDGINMHWFLSEVPQLEDYIIRKHKRKWELDIMWKTMSYHTLTRYNGIVAKRELSEAAERTSLRWHTSLQSFHLGIYLAKSYCQMSRNVNLWMVQPQANYKLKMTKMDLVLQQEDWIHRMIHREMTANCHFSSPISTKITKNGTQ